MNQPPSSARRIPRRPRASGKRPQARVPGGAPPIRTCRILPPSEIDWGLFLLFLLQAQKGNTYFTELAERVVECGSWAILPLGPGSVGDWIRDSSIHIPRRCESTLMCRNVILGSCILIRRRVTLVTPLHLHPASCIRTPCSHVRMSGCIAHPLHPRPPSGYTGHA